MPSSYANHNKDTLVSIPSKCPQYKIKADASFGGVTTYENIQFINFKSGKTYCGAEQRLIRLNRHNADYLPAVRFISTRFEVIIFIIINILECRTRINCISLYSTKWMGCCWRLWPIPMHRPIEHSDPIWAFNLRWINFAPSHRIKLPDHSCKWWEQWKLPNMQKGRWLEWILLQQRKLCHDYLGKSWRR